MSYFSDVERDLVVLARTEIAEGVVAFDLASPNGRDLPAWTPGSHLDLVLAPGLERQYSLCGDAEDRSHWRVAVLREDAGRGGSMRIHDELAPGARVRVRGPRNHFAFTADPAVRHRFVAGGIGITPMRAMLRAADAAGADWTLDYAGRSRSTMAFVDELAAAHPERVRVHAADEGTRLDVDALAAELAPEDRVYSCGPARLLAALEAAVPASQLHLERFEAKEFGDPVWAEPFEVELALSGDVVTVAPDQSILDAIAEQSPDTLVPASCRRGTCGTCEVAVLDGEIEHRDSVLTPLEQADSIVMMPCVSRAACARILLDI